MQAFLIFIYLLLGTTTVGVVHEFHLSKSTINYNTAEQSLQITMNIYIDDLEAALKNEGIDSLMICTKKEKDTAEEHIFNYISDHFNIKTDGTDLNLTYIGKEQSDDLAAIWCYLEVENIVSFRDLELSNTILISNFDDQKNMTTFQYDKTRITDILFTQSKTSETVNYEE